LNLLLLREADRQDGDRFVVRDHRAAHVATVLKKGPGDTVRVGLEDGPTGEATIAGADGDGLVLDAAFGETPTRPTVDLIVAVPRPKSLRKVLFEAAAVGVDRLVLVRTWRVDKSYLASPLLEPNGYLPILRDGLMQARHTALPKVHIERLFRPFVEDRAPGFTAGAEAFVIDPSATAHLAAAPVGADRTVLAIGPEGGFSTYEVESFERAGFAPRHLGARLLRVETACVAAMMITDGRRAIEARSKET
jgi:RsmE family RNA methyltransferase